jgi:aspartyl-tRNA(Asn)/glutamyl-tRNA(Gln) amidotransferase subunit C
MQIDKALILRLEHLTRLELSEEEREGLRKDLNDILAMVEKLRELDTDQVEPLVYLNEESNMLREDEVSGQAGREEALRSAPQTDGVFFRVPKVINLKNNKF